MSVKFDKLSKKELLELINTFYSMLTAKHMVVEKENEYIKQYLGSFLGDRECSMSEIKKELEDTKQKLLFSTEKLQDKMVEIDAIIEERDKYARMFTLSKERADAKDATILEMSNEIHRLNALVSKSSSEKSCLFALESKQRRKAISLRKKCYEVEKKLAYSEKSKEYIISNLKDIQNQYNKALWLEQQRYEELDKAAGAVFAQKNNEIARMKENCRKADVQNAKMSVDTTLLKQQNEALESELDHKNSKIVDLEYQISMLKRQIK